MTLPYGSPLGTSPISKRVLPKLPPKGTPYKDSSPQAIGPGSKKKPKPKPRPKPTNPYGSLGPSPQTVKKINAENAAQGLGKVVIDAAKGKGSASQAPTTQKEAASAEAGGRTKADLISAYNLERAKILQGMAPQIQDIYQQAGANIGGAVDAATQAAHDNLYAAGDAKASAFNPDKIDPRIAASYNIDAAPNAAAYLGKVLPQDTLNTQGASYGAAAAFLPAAALQEGQYALVKAVQDEKVSNADAAKVSASVSKMMGYVADAYGNPILGKNGKPIKLPDQNALTPYQAAQLKLSAGRLDLQVANAKARYDQSEAHFAAGMNFKTAKAKQDYEIAVAKGKRPNAALSAKFGYMVDSDGNAILNKKGRHIPVFTKAQTAKAQSVSDVKKIDDTVKGWYEGKPVQTGTKSGKNADGETVSEKQYTYTGQIGYQAGLRKLMRDYKMNLSDATAKLNQYYPRGKRGRPYVSLQEARWMLKQPKLVKQGITAALLRKARSGTSVDALNAATTIDFILRKNGITL